jgi:hypothetical protein
MEEKKTPESVMERKKTLGDYIFTSATRIMLIEKIYLNTGDNASRAILKRESSIQLRRALNFWLWVHLVKVPRKFPNASNPNASKGGK